MKDAYDSSVKPSDAQENIIKVALIANARFYADLRFKQLTLLVAVHSGSVYAAVTVADRHPATSPPPIAATLVISSIAMVFTAVMWIMEVRSTMYRDAAIRAAGDAWPHPVRRWPWISATFAVLVLHVVLFGSWLWFCSAEGGSIPIALAFGAIGLGLVGFSIVNYASLHGRSATAPGS